MSHSANALKPAIKAVKHATNNKYVSTAGIVIRKLKNRTRIKTPAVTRVEEWTSAETGVGAAIAAGSQLINGYCALFVVAAMISIMPVSVWVGHVHGERGNQFVFSDQAIVNKIKISPKRLVIAVIIAAP